MQTRINVDQRTQTWIGGKSNFRLPALGGEALVGRGSVRTGASRFALACDVIPFNSGVLVDHDKILGWDAAGVVEATGPECSLVLAPQGKFGVIYDPTSLDAKPLKRKSASLHWEFMFARSLFNTPDILEHHRLLNEVANLVEAGVIRTTVAETLGTISAANLKKAHALIESGRARGKPIPTECSIDEAVKKPSSEFQLKASILHRREG